MLMILQNDTARWYPKQSELLIVTEGYDLRDFVWYREQYNVLSNLFSEKAHADNIELDRLSILIVRHFADLHKFKIFHGDIKPQNIFYKENTITTDIGSAIDMTHPG